MIKFQVVNLYYHITVNSLAKWGNTHVQSEACRRLQLCEYDDDAKIRQTFQINTMPGGYAFLVWKDTLEEVVLDVTEFIANYTLPLITKKTK